MSWNDPHPTAAADAPSPAAVVVREAVARSGTRRLVHELLAAGRSRAEIARQLGVSKGTVSYHARRLGHTVAERCARRYDWSAIQAHHDAGHGMRECMAAFGFSSASWFHAVKRGVLVPRPVRMGLDELLVDGTPRGRFYLKARLLEEGVKDGRCEACGLDQWRGRPLTLALHHVNGRRHDNRLENLQLLCPNCHSQTDNFAGRNRRAPETSKRPGPQTPAASQSLPRSGLGAPAARQLPITGSGRPPPRCATR